MSAGDAHTRQIRRGQWLLFLAVAGVVAVLFAIWIGAGGGNDGPALAGIEAEVATPGDAEAGWVRLSETRLGGIEARLRDMETTNRRLEDENQRLQAQLQEQIEDARSVIDAQAAGIDALSQGDAATAPGVQNPFARPGITPPAGSTREAPSEGDAAGALSAPRLLEFQLEGPPHSSTPETVPIARPIADYVPAGSYAEAVVLAGADTSAGVQAQGDPRPVLLRLTSPAFGAAVDGVAEATDIEGCTVTGAAYGDLSSEKVYVRLQTMACAGDAAGTVIETPVSGFVAGAGKAGVRGPVVSREGALVQRAFLSGLFSGFGQGVNQAFRPQAVLAGGGTATFENTDFGDIGRAGLGAGAGTAGEQISDYLIRRAEQYQPVIQLAAGTPVTVVFIEGAWLDGRPGMDGGNQG